MMKKTPTIAEVQDSSTKLLDALNELQAAVAYAIRVVSPRPAKRKKVPVHRTLLKHIDEQGPSSVDQLLVAMVGILGHGPEARRRLERGLKILVGQGVLEKDYGKYRRPV